MKRLYIMCALHRVLSESEHCVRHESPVSVGLPGPSLARKQKGRGGRFILHTADNCDCYISGKPGTAWPGGEIDAGRISFSRRAEKTATKGVKRGF